MWVMFDGVLMGGFYVNSYVYVLVNISRVDYKYIWIIGMA